MKDPFEVLRQKEKDLDRIRKEIEVLRIAAPLLSEETDPDKNAKPSLVGGASPRRSGSGN